MPSHLYEPTVMGNRQLVHLTYGIVQSLAARCFSKGTLPGGRLRASGFFSRPPSSSLIFNRKSVCLGDLQRLRQGWVDGFPEGSARPRFPSTSPGRARPRRPAPSSAQASLRSALRNPRALPLMHPSHSALDVNTLHGGPLPLGKSARWPRGRIQLAHS